STPWMEAIRSRKKRLLPRCASTQDLPMRPARPAPVSLQAEAVDPDHQRRGAPGIEAEVQRFRRGHGVARPLPIGVAAQRKGEVGPALAGLVVGRGTEQIANGRELGLLAID